MTIQEQLTGIGKDAGTRLADEFIRANRIGGPLVVEVLQRRIDDVRQILTPHLSPADVAREADEMEAAFWGRISAVVDAVSQHQGGHA